MTKRREFGFARWGVVVLAVLVGGCQTVTVKDPVPSGSSGGAVAPLPVNRAATADEAVASAPSAIRLHDIEGAMLMYYVLHQRLPTVLEELKPLADAGTDLQLASPESGQPYSYSSDGLVLAGSTKRIIVWDPVPGHNGKRWCILMPRTAAGGAVSLELVDIPEAGFQVYVPPIN